MQGTSSKNQPFQALRRHLNLGEMLREEREFNQLVLLEVSGHGAVWLKINIRFYIEKMKPDLKAEMSEFCETTSFYVFFSLKVIYENMYFKWQPINVLFAVHTQKLQKYLINDKAFIFPALLSYNKSIGQVCPELLQHWSVIWDSHTLMFSVFPEL